MSEREREGEGREGGEEGEGGEEERERGREEVELGKSREAPAGPPTLGMSMTSLSTTTLK